MFFAVFWRFPSVEFRMTVSEQNCSDAIFWERLEEMPDIEAEMELSKRRVIVIRENAELQAFLSGRFNKDAERAGERMRDNNLQLVMLNEELKIVRKRMDRVSWKNAVVACFGQEAMETCLHWIRQNELG